ncbi:MAG: aminotransferase class I and II [Candidatus Aminicenantes bacterium RBG_13_62_12]|nr:MAG: aminotransferase class I and II [Candidatus Aminicenantes bacterium RBG_13_62_12]
MVSEKANQIGTSPTLKISAKARAMRAEGIDVIDLSVGEPDFNTPANVKAAGVKAIEDNFTKYTENEGIPELKKAVIDRLREDHGLSYAPGEVIISTGAKSSLFHLLQALVNEGEEVIIPAPYWVTYPHLVTLAKGKPVVVPTREEHGFLLTPEALKAAITPATKAVLLNNPSNPTGATYARPQLEALAAVIRGEDLYVIADEIYGKLVYDGFAFTPFASLGEDVKKKTILIDGVSKSYSMTGWRIGYAAGPADIIGAMAKIQSHTTSNPCSISQKAALEALRGPQHEVSRMAAEFQRRRNYVFMRLQAVAGLSCFKPQGAFYLFPNVSSFYDKEFQGMRMRNSYGLAYYLLKEARLAIVPGDAFAADEHIRLSYATSMENLEKGLDRIVKALSDLKPSRKARVAALNNTQTRVRKSVPVEPAVTVPLRDALAAEMENHLVSSPVYEWNVNIQGVIVRLRTNVAHLYDFWMENWYPSPLEGGLEPHGVLYAVDGIAGREPRAYFNSETRTGVLVNTDAYGPVRSLALGLVMDTAERMLLSHGVRGMVAEVGGRLLALVGPPGTRKTELFFDLLRDGRFRLHSTDQFFVRHAGDGPVADNVERKLYLPTNTVESRPPLAPLFDASKCENVVVKKEDCQNAACLRGEDCRLDRGSLFCYKASKESHALLDPGWLGSASYARRGVLRWVFLLRNDPTSPAVVELDREEALRLLESGEIPGQKKGLGSSGNAPYFNPHLLASSPERMELHKNLWRRLLQDVSVYLFNSGAGGAADLKKAVTGVED